MEVIDHLEACPRPPEGCVVTIGNFDGVHKGHASVIGTLQSRARDLGAATAVVTFEPHTLETIRPDIAPHRLTLEDRKLELLDELGLDFATVLTFDAERSRQSAEGFIEEILAGCLHARLVMVGPDFRFGHGARGDVDLLREMGPELGFMVEPIAPVAGPSGVYSSTAIRKALAAGHLDVVTEALGRPYDLRGRVIAGDERGRRLGFPTANVDPGPKVAVPPYGVYAGRIRIADTSESPGKEWCDCVINFGVRPTVREEGDDPRPLVEAHIFDFEDDIYDRIVDVAFTHHLRDEKKFASLGELEAAIAADSEQARNLLAE